MKRSGILLLARLCAIIDTRLKCEKYDVAVISQWISKRNRIVLHVK